MAREQAEIRADMAGGMSTHHLAAGLADSCSCTRQSDVMRWPSGGREGEPGLGVLIRGGGMGGLRVRPASAARQKQSRFSTCVFESRGCRQTGRQAGEQAAVRLQGRKRIQGGGGGGHKRRGVRRTGCWRGNRLWRGAVFLRAVRARVGGTLDDVWGSLG